MSFRESSYYRSWQDNGSGRVRGGFQGTRGSFQGFSERSAHGNYWPGRSVQPSSAEPALGPILSTLSQAGFTKAAGMYKSDSVITDCVTVSSYNWLDRTKPTIVVPGKPQCSFDSGLTDGREQASRRDGHRLLSLDNSSLTTGSTFVTPIPRITRSIPWSRPSSPCWLKMPVTREIMMSSPAAVLLETSCGLFAGRTSSLGSWWNLSTGPCSLFDGRTHRVSSSQMSEDTVTRSQRLTLRGMLTSRDLCHTSELSHTDSVDFAS